MKFYQEITLLPDAKNNFGVLWQKVYQQIHIALVEHKIEANSSSIGLSFPKYNNDSLNLGNQLRLFAEKSELEKLNIHEWLSQYEDNVHIKSIKPVPDDVKQYACFTRKEIKGKQRIAKTIYNKARYQSQKFSLPFEECLEKAKASAPKAFSPLPFIKVHRSENEKEQGKHSFNIFIEMTIQSEPSNNSFTCYGLSRRGIDQQVAIPWF